MNSVKMTAWSSVAIIGMLVTSITVLAVVGSIQPRMLELFVASVISAIAPTIAASMAAVSASKAADTSKHIDQTVTRVESKVNQVESEMNT